MQISNSMQNINIIPNNNINPTGLDQQNIDIEQQLINNQNLEATRISRFRTRVLQPSEVFRRVVNNTSKLFSAIIGIIVTLQAVSFVIWLLNVSNIINIPSELFYGVEIFLLITTSIEIIIYFLVRCFQSNFLCSICNSLTLASSVKDLKKIKYKNLEGYQGDITEFLNKPSIILLEKLNSKFLKDPIVYKKQLYSFKEFKKAIILSRGKVPHDRSLVEINEIKRIKTSDSDILESIV
jgi:hypothetical protein